MTKVDATTTPKPSIKYRVAINHVEPWKIQSIARFKAKLAKKDSKPQTTQTLEKKKGQKKSTPPAATSSNKSVASQIRANLIESTLRDLAQYNYNSSVIKNRIAALHSVRSSLLWLLKKTAVHERSMINDYLSAPSN
jgi:hypothetical protein